jgi:phosphomannomutase
MALILHLLAETGQTISELVHSFPRFTMVKQKLLCPSDKIAPVLRMLRREYAAYPQDLRDGVKIILPSGWFLVRGSNTEPIVRVIAEAANETAAREIVAGVLKQVQACVNS